MLANTLTFTVNAVAKVLTRIKESGTSSIYKLKEANGTFTVTIKQTSYKDSSRGILVYRHALDMVHTINPLAPSIIPEIRKCYIVIERDVSVVDFATVQHIVKAVTDFVGTPANNLMLISEEY